MAGECAMTSDNDTARDVARIQSRATTISALLGFFGVIVAALIGTAVGKSQGRQESRQTVSTQEGQIAQLQSENEGLKRQLAQPPNSKTPITATDAGSDDDSVYGGALVAQKEEQGFVIKFFGCRRTSSAVKCYFAITNTKAERKFQLAGYPQDLRYSRAYDDHGEQHTANTPEVSGSTGEVTIPDGLTVRASLVFATVPAPVHRFTDLKFVFFYTNNQYAVDFRDITFG
jgi:hypothetical protein